MSFVGDPRGRSSSCTFYGGFEYKNRSGPATLSVGQFVYVRISPNDDPCIAELQLLWKDHQHSAQLASVQLYFLPEQTPDGRLPHQGQHEVLAASEKAVLRLEDFVGCITDEVEWSHGLLAGPPSEGTSSPGVVVLSYPRYCRYRALLKRLEGHWPPEGSLALLLGADQLLPRGGGACRLLFCRDTFDHEALAHNDLICDHLAPVERGRQRKRIRKANSGSESSEEGSSEVTAAPSTPSKPSVHHGKTAQDKTADVKLEKVKSEKMSLDSIPEVKPAKEKTAQDKVPLDRMPQGRMSQDLLPDTVPQERKPHDKILLDKTRNGADEFLRRLFQFMKERNTPIQRVPHLGFKQIDLYHFYQFSQRLGGYEKITGRKQWKQVYDQLGGDPSSTSAATCTRRHYERLLLPFELHLRGEDRPPCWRLEEAPSDCQVLDLSMRREAPTPPQCLDLRVHRRGDENCGALQGSPLYSVYRLEDAW
ncbi:AT-rich interactive domain-containing protein 5B-like isoform X1 [Dermacentor andersoni]|uniref:AT-rich interactive domain-containing protein 5B-like isoform X1 n=1 Tax=Dermacentor andersoni TaxID=34620 RepID=UPI002155BD3A|nr:AT-rich interactive domain-containing protein 5B-like isoform X1 [Dermacentor andersoni]